MSSRYPEFLLRSQAPPRWAGVLTAALAIALCTLLVYPLKRVAPVVSLGVVYMVGVLAISAAWGAWLGALTAVGSAGAYSFFHIPPVGEFGIHGSKDWVALIAFLVAAGLASWMSQAARARARDADERRLEADLAAEMARLLLGGGGVAEALARVPSCLNRAIGLPWSAIELGAGDATDASFALRDGDTQIGVLRFPSVTSDARRRRLRARVVPALEALLAAALERERLHAEVVETAALRRADVVKTALLRAVSHDLRSPLTAIQTAGESVASPALAQAEREELASVIQEESRRLARVVDDLLHLSRLEAGAAESRREWVSLAEIAGSALAGLAGEFSLRVDPELPLVRADAAQLERALANVLENAGRYSGGEPVTVGACVEQERLLVSVADRGPGIAPEHLQRIFEPFYRADAQVSGHRGSGLGLAIARGFVEANGGTLRVESLPGRGSTFRFELPLGETPGPAAPPAVVGHGAGGA